MQSIGFSMHPKFRALSNETKLFYVLLRDSVRIEKETNLRNGEEGFLVVSREQAEKMLEYEKLDIEKGWKELLENDLLKAQGSGRFILFELGMIEEKRKNAPMSGAERQRLYRERKKMRLAKSDTPVMENVTEKEEGKKKGKGKKKNPLESPDFKIASMVIDAINKRNDTSEATMQVFRAANGWKPTEHAKWIMKRVRKLRKEGVFNYPDLTEEDLQEFFLRFIELRAQDEWYVNQGHLKPSTLFQWDSSWQKRFEETLVGWIPPARRRYMERHKEKRGQCIKF